MTDKKVSVIIPVYNAEKHIERAVQSVLKQSYQNFELILVDDGSTDKSKDICEKLIEKDARVKYFYKENGGPSSARNIGIKMSAGEYLAFVDSDDYVEKNYIDSMIKNLNESDLVICGYNLINKKKVEHKIKNKCSVDFRENAGIFFSLVKTFLLHSPCNKLYKKSLINQMFDDKYYIGEDVIFNINYLKNCKNVCLIPNVLYNYDNTNQSSLTSTRVRTDLNFKQYWNELFEFCESYFLDKSYIKKLNGFYVKSSLNQIIKKTQKEKLGYKDFKKVFKTYRNEAKQKNVFKKFDKNVFISQKLFGRILLHCYRLNLNIVVYIASKIYKK